MMQNHDLIHGILNLESKGHLKLNNCGKCTKYESSAVRKGLMFCTVLATGVKAISNSYTITCPHVRGNNP